jgi:hypothetical protein
MAAAAVSAGGSGVLPLCSLSVMLFLLLLLLLLLLLSLHMGWFVPCCVSCCFAT